MLYCKQDFDDIGIVSQDRVLIVEDSEVINKIIYEKLKELGHYELEQSFDFNDASKKLSNNSFDFVILDLNLPDAYGEELVNNIKNLTDAKIIVLTSEVDIQIRETLFKSGILDYLVKDKDFEFSIKSIDRVVNAIKKNISSTILVIDDSMFMCKQIQNILSVRNYNTVLAYNSKDGLDILDTKDINLIILDMDLPDIHGLDLLRIIKDKDEFCHVPIIILSGSNDPELIRNCLKIGASDFVRKPFSIEEFTLKVDLAIDLNRKHIEILCKQKMLNEYKDVVDKSYIVSKTDKKGIITFVNEQFCKISGYTKEELIGQPHSIVRHPDMPSSAFKEMWETIKSKKTWSGKIKNLKKDGSFYYVQSTINPIVDYDGNIVEYIAVRNDITDLELLKLELEENLNITNKNFIQAYKISQEYQKAIETSNMLFRIDTNGNITFVNELFCKVSGYSKDELVGKSYKHLNWNCISDRTYKKIMNTITSGKIWKGQIKSRKKDGTIYYVESTVVPIIDADEKIIEYLGIRQDITDIVTVHKELEKTQKEIIYKMGEVAESRSLETGNHVKRVAEYSRLLAILAGLGRKNADLIFTASPMHDIGKVGIPDSILLKPGKLTDDEWEIMKTHSKVGYEILKDSTRPILKAAALIAYRHHEKWDGSGYPVGVAGKDIHIFARITAIADVFDALSNDRVYKKAWKLEDILEFFKDQRGKHFDPKLVDIFLDNFDKFLLIRDKFKDSE